MVPKTMAKIRVARAPRTENTADEAAVASAIWPLLKRACMGVVSLFSSHSETLPNTVIAAAIDGSNRNAIPMLMGLLMLKEMFRLVGMGRRLATAQKTSHQAMSAKFARPK